MLEASAPESQLRVAERLRLEAARSLAYDPELDAIEQELRVDLRNRGGKLSWDTCRPDLQSRLFSSKVADAATANSRMQQPPTTTASAVADASREGASSPQAERVDSLAGFGDDDEAAAPMEGQRSLRFAALPEAKVQDVDNLTGFGEDEEEETTRALAVDTSRNIQDVWEMTTQMAVKLEHHMIVTIFENGARGLIKFHGFNAASGEVEQRICSHERFDELCKRAGGSRPADAVRLLFSEAQDETDFTRAEPQSPLLPPDQRGRRRVSDAFANFGESDGESEAASPKPVPVLVCEEGRGSASMHDVSAKKDGWTVLAQEAMMMDEKHCTVTISEDPDRGLLMFQAFQVDADSAEKISRHCSYEEFEKRCTQSKHRGGKKFREAILDLLRQPQQEVEESSGSDAVVKARRRRLSTELSHFGESDESPKPKASQLPKLMEGEETSQGAPDGYRLLSQQAFSMHGEHALLTIFQNDEEQTMQFRLMRNSSGETLQKDCGVQAFDVLCNRYSNMSEPARLSAAIADVFK